MTSGTLFSRILSRDSLKTRVQHVAGLGIKLTLGRQSIDDDHDMNSLDYPTLGYDLFYRLLLRGKKINDRSLLFLAAFFTAKAIANKLPVALEAR